LKEDILLDIVDLEESKKARKIITNYCWKSIGSISRDYLCPNQRKEWQL
jgi:hypothetical protein